MPIKDNIMKFKAYANAVKVDLAKNEITLTFKVTADQEAMEEAKKLSLYCGEDAGAGDLNVHPHQTRS